MPDRFMVTNTATTKKKNKVSPWKPKTRQLNDFSGYFFFFLCSMNQKDGERHKFSFCVFYIFAASECIK